MIHVGDCLETLRTLPNRSVQTCVTSPPYWGLRDYGVAGQLGLEKTPEEYVAKMVDVFREVRRVLRDDGTLWLNLGDSYSGSTMTGGNNGINGSGGDNGFKIKRQFDKPKQCDSLKPKDLVGIPWRVAFALQSDGWYLRQDIIWHKPNPMPESVRDRCTKAHEYLFLLSKSPKYYFDSDAIKEDGTGRRCNEFRRGVYVNNESFNNSGILNGSRGEHIGDIKRNRRSVWTVATQPFKESHFATFPPKLIEPCVLAGSREGDTVLDPFNGAGTTGLVATRNGREYIGIELNPEYAAMAERRIEAERQKMPLLEAVS